MIHRRLVTAPLIALGFGCLSGLPAQVSSTRVRTDTVVVDVSVRDRNGRPVDSLPQSAFRVYEDGVEQEITSFQQFTHAGQVGAEGHGSSDPSAGESGFPGSAAGEGVEVEGLFTALVIDRLAPTSRTFARRAALKYVEEAPDDAHIGVFFTDSSLRTLQFYTRDKRALTRTISRALGGRDEGEGDDREGTANISETGGGVSDASAVEGQDLTTGAGASAAGLGAMSYRMTSMADRLSQSQLGYATTDSLHAIVSSLEPLAGRKAILYFSEGISLPPGVETRFRSLIHSANRAGVSFYPVDAAGLRIQSTGAFAQQGIGRAAGISDSATSGSGATSGLGPYSREVLEKNETLLRTDAHATLNRLAEETGGLLIRETNDLEKGVRDIHQDLYNYYLLTYTPKNTTFDGEFRSIEVKVDHRDARTVRFRKGYFAIDSSIQEPVTDFEAPVLALLGSGRTDSSILLRSSVLSYPEPDDQGHISILAQVEPGTMTYQKENGYYVSDFAILALVRDESGKVAEKLSQHYRILGQEIPSTAPSDGILFYREAHLAPGNYTVEIAAYDAHNEKFGVSRPALQIPAGNAGLPGLSSVIVVQTAEALEGPADTVESPLRYQNLLLYPNLGQPISKAEYPEVTFYFTVFPTGERPEEVFVDIVRGGQRLQTLKVPLPEPDEKGRIQVASGLPTGQLDPGVYTLKVMVPAGDKLVGRSCRFQLAP